MSPITTEKDKKLYRIFQTIPGTLTWLLFFSPIWLGILAPRVLIYYVTFLTVYWFYLGLKHSYGVVVGYRRYKDEQKIDWYQKLVELNFDILPEKSTLPKSLSDFRFFLLIPCVNEPYDVLKASFDSILDQPFPTNQINLVYGIEEKYAAMTSENIKKITGQHKDKFEDIQIYIHPAGIPGEAKGVAGANRSWAAKHAVEKMRSENKNLRNYMFATLDSDHVYDNQFLSRMACLYLTSDKRDNKYYSTAVHLFSNNLWDCPLLSRIEAHSVTLGSLSDWVVSNPTLHESFSNYGASLQTLIDADFWDVQLGVDDTIFYWRAFFARDGDFEGVCHYVPYSADAVLSEGVVKTYCSLYLQLRRWGWGAISFPMSLVGFMKNHKIPFFKKFMWFFTHIKMKVFMLSVVFIMTFGVSILTLVNQDARYINLVYSIPKIMSYILTLTMVFLIPITYVKIKINGGIPKNLNVFRKLLVFIEGPLIIINLFTFSLIPFLDAQTRMIFGKAMKDLYHTPKMRRV